MDPSEPVAGECRTGVHRARGYGRDSIRFRLPIEEAWFPVLSILGTAKVAVALLVLGVPIIDTFWIIVRRIRSGSSPFTPDRGHIHHRLLLRGWSPTQIAVTYFGFTVAATLTAVLLPMAGADGLWLWAIAALILTTATMAEIWRSTRARVRARDLIHLYPAEPCAHESMGARAVVSRTHQHPLPDELFQRTGTGG